MSKLSLNAGEIIYATGERSDVIYLIVSGTAEIQVTLHGKGLTLQVGPGDFIGDSALIFREVEDTPTYKGTATAVTDVVLNAIPLEVLKAELETASPLLKAWIASFIDRAFQAVDQAAR